MSNLTKPVYLTNESFELLECFSENEGLSINETLSKVLDSYDSKDCPEDYKFERNKQDAIQHLTAKDKNLFDALKNIKCNVTWYVKNNEIWAQIENSDYNNNKGNANDPEILKIVCECAMHLGQDWKKSNGRLYVTAYTAITALIHYPTNFKVHPMDVCRIIRDHILGEIPQLKGVAAKDNAMKLFKQINPISEDDQEYAQERLNKLLERMTGIGNLNTSENSLFLDVINFAPQANLEGYKNLITDSFWNDISECIKSGFWGIEAVDYAFWKHTPYF